MAKKTPQFSVGDKVAYAAGFLKNTGQLTTGAADVRGTVTGISDLGGNSFITFQCADGRERSALATNLARVGSARFGDTYA